MWIIGIRSIDYNSLEEKFNAIRCVNQDCVGNMAIDIP